MKKSIIVLLVVLICISSVSAIEFNLKEEYKQGETIITKISGTFLTAFSKENILFYDKWVKTPFDYNLVKAGDDYYLYVSLSGKSQGNYSVAIENVQYSKAGSSSEEKISRNFSITNETAKFSVTPGAVSTSEDFSLELQNLIDSSLDIEVETDANDSEERDILILPDKTTETSFSLQSGEAKEIEFTLAPGNPALKKIRIKSGDFSYEIPIYLSTYMEGIQENAFSLEPSSSIFSFSLNSATKKIINVYNLGDTELKDISLSLSDSLVPFVNLSTDSIKSLSAHSFVPVELSFFSKADARAEGELKAKAGELISYSAISAKFIQNYTPIAGDNIQSSEKTCSELSGTVCTGEEKCDVEPTHATDYLCCVGGKCKTESGSSSSSKVIAIIIVIVLIGAIVWFYFAKYKKAKSVPKF